MGVNWGPPCYGGILGPPEMGGSLELCVPPGNSSECPCLYGKLNKELKLLGSV